MCIYNLPILSDTMKQFARIVSAMLLLLYIVFVYQNYARLPMLDTQGGYLSLDLYFMGIQMSQPISVAWLLGIAFLIGVMLNPLIVYVFSKTENKDDFYNDDY